MATAPGTHSDLQPRLPNLRKLLVTAEQQGHYRVIPLPGCLKYRPRSNYDSISSKQSLVGLLTTVEALKMATGSGKTITALFVACELYQNRLASIAGSLSLSAFSHPMGARMRKI